MNKATAKVRHMYRRALLKSGKSLTPAERHVAMIYEEHAGYAGVGSVFVTNAVLTEWTGLSVRAISAARGALVAKGWLQETTPATPRTAARYALTLPDDVVSDVPADTEPGDVRMIPGARVTHDGGEEHRVPVPRETVVPFRRRGERPTFVPSWDGDEAPECERDGQRLRPDGTCPICARLTAAPAF